MTSRHILEDTTARIHLGLASKKIAVPTKCFPKASQESSVFTLWFRGPQKHQAPEAKRTRGYYSRHDFIHGIFLLLSTNRGHLLNGRSSAVSLSSLSFPQDLKNTWYPQCSVQSTIQYVYISGYYFSPILEIQHLSVHI